MATAFLSAARHKVRTKPLAVGKAANSRNGNFHCRKNRQRNEPMSIIRKGIDFRSHLLLKSVFVQQQGVECGLASSDPWGILSLIEQSIKRKIEATGTPLKD